MDMIGTPVICQYQVNFNMKNKVVWTVDMTFTLDTPFKINLVNTKMYQLMGISV